NAPAYDLVLKFLLPLAIPLLLFRADLRRVISSTGILLLPFLLGSVATTIGTVVAYLLVPMRSLGQDSWKIAAALMGRHIGGAVNYVAISDALGVPPSILAAGLAADNVICAVYFSTLFLLASKTPPESSASGNDDAMTTMSGSGDKLPVLQMATSLAVSFAMCKVANILTGYFGIQGVQITVHLALILGLGRLFRFDLKLLLIASNANVGGPTTACGMATAKGWTSLILPGILAGIFGIAIATFLGIGFGLKVLKYM
ncbi:hypothetical protein TSUD_44070, partial [Trifolium subterraneum]